MARLNRIEQSVKLDIKMELEFHRLLLLGCSLTLFGRPDRAADHILYEPGSEWHDRNCVWTAQVRGSHIGRFQKNRTREPTSHAQPVHFVAPRAPKYKTQGVLEDSSAQTCIEPGGKAYVKD